MSARAESLTTERAVWSRALQVTLHELRVRTMSGGETTLLQLQPMLGTCRKKYSSVPCSRGAGEKAASSQRGWWGERCQETLQVWPSIQLLKGELNYAFKRNQQPGSCLVIHTCLGERCESAGTSQQPLCQRTPARSRQYSFTGWVHQARCPKPWALPPQPRQHLHNYTWSVSAPVLGTIPPT